MKIRRSCERTRGAKKQALFKRLFRHIGLLSFLAVHGHSTQAPCPTLLASSTGILARLVSC